MKKLLWILLLVAVAAGQYTDTIYNNFATFADTYFGTKRDSLYFTYTGLSKDTIVLDTARWKHVSLNSMCLFTTTKLPARSWLEYGTTDGYGSVSDTTFDKRHYFNHLHYATGLDTNTTYHYRMVYVNKSGDTLRTFDSTFATVASFANKIKIPGALGSTPYTLSTGGKYYVLTENIDADSTAIYAKAASDTIDLNGFTITYHKIRQALGSYDFSVIRPRTGDGIKALNYKDNIVIRNGWIVEGEGFDTSASNSAGYNPIQINNSSHSICGISAKWWSCQASGIFSYSDVSAKYNVLYDFGWDMVNRDAGADAIGSNGKASVIQWNRISRARHRGVKGSLVAVGNEIYTDGMFTNAFCVHMYQASDTTGYYGDIHSNKIHGTGYHTIGVSWWNNLRFYNNLIHMEGSSALLSTVHGYGSQASLIGIRLTQYGGSSKPLESIHYNDNVVMIHSRDTCQARGFQVASDSFYHNIVFENNHVKAVRDDYSIYDHPLDLSNAPGNIACVVTQGVRKIDDENLPIIRNNTFYSNYCFIRFGDYYSSNGGGHRFENNIFVKIDTLSDGDNPFINFSTYSYSAQYNINHKILNPTIVGDFNIDTMSHYYGDSTTANYYCGNHLVAYNLHLKTDSGATVTVKNVFDSTVSIDTLAGDSIALELDRYVQYHWATRGKKYYEPYSITITKGDSVVTIENYYPKPRRDTTLYVSGLIPEIPYYSSPVFTIYDTLYNLTGSDFGVTVGGGSWKKKLYLQRADVEEGPWSAVDSTAAINTNVRDTLSASGAGYYRVTGKTSK